MANIQDKIRKLLALAANNTSETEAQAAMLKARELMAQNKLTERDIEDSKPKNVQRKMFADIKWTTDSGDIWMVKLAEAICPNYCCATAWQTQMGRRTHYLVMMGAEEDMQVCSEVLKYAIGFIRWEAKKLLFRTPAGDPIGIRQSYAKGFTKGIEEMFMAQNSDQSEWGLVMVTPKEAQDWRASLSTKEVAFKTGSPSTEAYLLGHEEGVRFNPTNKLGTVN